MQLLYQIQTYLKNVLPLPWLSREVPIWDTGPGCNEACRRLFPPTWRPGQWWRMEHASSVSRTLRTLKKPWETVGRRPDIRRKAKEHEKNPGFGKNRLCETKSLTLQEMLKVSSRPGAMAHTHNPRASGGWSERITWGREFETRLGNIVRLCLYKKIFLIS